MWEIVADEVRRRGGEVLTGHRASGFRVEGSRIVEVTATETATGREKRLAADYVFSSMAIDELVRGLGDAVPTDAREIAGGLIFRDFFTVGLLVDRMRLQDEAGGPVRDNWIYIQEPDVLLGRLQIFNNWSPYLVADRSKTWLGLEYFCNATDEIWSRPDDALINLGRRELAKIAIIDEKDAIDGCVIRVRKTYPAYFGAYSRFADLRQALDRFENLFCVGRNGQHRYNNQDHSMLTAMLAVDYLAAGRPDKTSIWDVNAEQEYHETSDGASKQGVSGRG
jgi:protoporphyrinogen oxidase